MSVSSTTPLNVPREATTPQPQAGTSTSHLPTTGPTTTSTRPTPGSSDARPRFPIINFTPLGDDVLLHRPTVRLSAVLNADFDGDTGTRGSSTTPHGKRVDDDVPPPKLIVVFGFMNASTKQLARWTGTYSQIYPLATIALVKMSPKYFFVSEKEQERKVQPVYDLLMAEIYDPELAKREKAENRGLLVHLLSNGGGFQFAVLARMLARHFSSLGPNEQPSQQPPAFPLLQVHDSVPGTSSLASISAFTVPLSALPLPSSLVSLLRIIAYLPAALVVTSTIAVYWVTGRDMRMDVAERGEVDRGGSGGGRGRAFGNMRRWVRIGLPVGGHSNAEEEGSPIARLYVYSDKDDQVSPNGVESHVADTLASLKPIIPSSQSSLSSAHSLRHPPPRPTTFLPNSSTTPHPLIRVEKFTGSSHINHARADPDRYWSAVGDMWAVAVDETIKRQGAKL